MRDCYKLGRAAEPAPKMFAKNQQIAGPLARRIIRAAPWFLVGRGGVGDCRGGGAGTRAVAVRSICQIVM